MSEAQRGIPKSKEAIEKVAAANRGKIRGPMSDETKFKLSVSLKGRKVSEETRSKIAASLTGKSFVSAEGRKKISAANTGKIVSEETKKKLSEAAKQRELKKRIEREKNVIQL
jgi:hypothetical protein